MNRLTIASLAAFMLAGAAPLAAADGVDPLSASATKGAPALHGMSRDEFLAFHRDLARSEELRALGRIARDKVAAAQATIEELLAGESGVESLSERERVDLFNAHERVVAIVNGEERERVACKHRRAAGSHLKVVECRSVSERERLAQESRQQIRNPRHTPY